MKKNLFFFAAIAAAALASCTKETVPVEQPKPASYGTIKAVIDQDDTKATVDDLKFAFEKGDELTVFNGAGHSVVYYTCDTVVAGVATFSVIEQTPNTPDPSITEIIATMPRRSTTTGEYVSDGTVQIMLPQNHTGITSTECPGYDPSAIPFVAYSADAQGVLHFKQTCGIVELTLKGTAKISKIVLESETENAISGKCNVNYKDEAPVVTMTGTTKVANYPYNTPVQLTADGVKFYFGLPVGTHNIKFTFYDDAFGSMTKTATGLTIERGVMVPTTLTYNGTVDATNLSEGEAYANCYVIPEAGVYCFDAKMPDGTDLSTSCASADWVWATSGEWNPSDWTTASVTDITWYNKLANQVKYIDGKIYVNATMSTTGDLVVGAFDNDGAFVWSWHLWFTKDLADVKVGDYTWMDRNLGCGYKTDVTNNNATQTNAARGWFYAAGRKDPIVGARVNGTDEGFPVIASNKGTAFYVYNQNIKDLSDWNIGSTAFTSDLDALKKPLTIVTDQKNLPNYTSGTCWTTLSNPCPSGYIVATKAAFDALGNNMTIKNNGNSYQAESEGLVFPISGYRSNNSSDKGIRKNGTVDARIWTSTTSGTNVYYCKITASNGNSARSAGGRANGNSVRCIKK